MIEPRTQVAGSHPMDRLLRSDRLPHIWCPGCGLGAVMAAYERAMSASGIPEDRQVCVSGIGCTGRIAGYVHIDSFHTTHGRAVAFATGMHLANPDLEVTVVSGDGDLATIGGNHLLHAIRRNVNINILCVNNFTYGMTGGQFGATTPTGSITATTPYGNVEGALNLPDLAASLGAPFVARWTTLHVRQLERALERMMAVDGLAFVEVLSPCTPGFGKLNHFRTGMDQMRCFRERCVVDHGADTRDVAVSFEGDGPIVLGDFIDRDRPSYLAARRRVLGHLG